MFSVEGVKGFRVSRAEGLNSSVLGVWRKSHISQFLSPKISEELGLTCQLRCDAWRPLPCEWQRKFGFRV